MKKVTFLSCAGILASLLLTGCNNSGPKDPTPNPPAPPEQEEKAPMVFVFSGQSNMEGSTMWKYPGATGAHLLEDYMESEGMDTDGVMNGIPEGLTSYYGFYYPNKWGQAHSSSQDQSSPEAFEHREQWSICYSRFSRL